MKYLICLTALFFISCGHCPDENLNGLHLAREYINNSEFMNANMDLIRYRYSDQTEFSGYFFILVGEITGETTRIVRMLAKYDSEIIQIQLPYNMIKIVIEDIDAPFINIDYKCSDWQIDLSCSCALSVEENPTGYDRKRYRNFESFRANFDSRLENKTDFINRYATRITVHIREEDIAPGFNFEF